MASEASVGLGPIVGAEWLRAHLDDSDLRLIHIGIEPDEYARGHLEGAVWAHGYDDLAEEREGVRAQAPSVPTAERVLGRLGIAPEHRVVLYASTKSAWPARGYWVLRHLGFPRVHVAEGSLDALREAGLPVSTEPTSYPPVEVRLGAPDASIVATVDDVLATAQGSGDVVLDCRTDDEWHGLAGGHAPQPRLGRIPRAVHLNWELLVDDAGRFLPEAQLRSLFAAAGIDGSRPAFPYCGGGIRAAVGWFVMHELLGFKQARNYDGSWSEWAARADLPIETG